MRRRDFMAGAAAGVGVLATARRAAAFDWTGFKGKNITVRMIAQRQPWTTMVAGWTDEFEQATGVKAVIDLLPQEQYNQRLGVEVPRAAGRSTSSLRSPRKTGSSSGWPGSRRRSRAT